MRILYVRNLYRPVDFGGNRYAVEVTTRLARRGHDVVVITGRFAGPPPSGCDGVRIVQYPLSRRYPLLTFVSHAAASTRAVRRVSRRWSPDVVVFGSWDSAYGYFRIPPIGSAPSVFVYHSSFHSQAVRGLAERRWPLRTLRRPASAFVQHVERFVLQSAQRTIAVSPFSRTEITRRLGHDPGEACEVIGTGVDTRVFSPGEGAKARAELALDPDVLVLVTLGRLVPVKRYDRALRAVAQLRATGRPVVLMIIGTGPEEAALKALAEELAISDAVRFEGFRDADELVLRLRAADIQLCTSEFENWSLSLLEGLACGVPALGTPFGGTSALLEPIDPSLVLANGDETELVAAIRALDEDPDRRRDLGRRARRRAEHFDWDEVVERLESSLLSLARSDAARHC